MKNPWILGVGWLLILLFVFPFGSEWGGMMGWYGGMMGGGMLGYGLLYLVLITVLVSLIFSTVFKWVWKDGNGKDHALEMLKSRYAKGEITKEQYESMKKDIQGK